MTDVTSGNPGDGTYPTIYDEQGRAVWSVYSDMTSRMLHSIDNEAVLTLDGSTIRRIGFDGEVEHYVKVSSGHTDFVEVEEGTYAILVRDVVEYEDGERSIMGDAIVEVTADGERTQIWSVFDNFSPDLSMSFSTYYLNDEGTNVAVEDWSHGNGISYHAEEDAYLIVLANFEAIAQIDRATGTMNWLIAEASIEGVEDGDEPHGDFDNGGESLVAAPHSAHQVDDSTVVLFNRRGYTLSDCSEVTEITLDHEAATATESWSYETEDCLYVYYLGGALPLPNGNFLAVWTTSGRMEQVTPAGESVWRLEVDVGTFLGFSDFSASLY